MHSIYIPVYSSIYITVNMYILLCFVREFAIEITPVCKYCEFPNVFPKNVSVFFIFFPLGTKQCNLGEISTSITRSSNSNQPIEAATKITTTNTKIMNRENGFQCGHSVKNQVEHRSVR
jgi:hypothetical protein